MPTSAIVLLKDYLITEPRTGPILDVSLSIDKPGLIGIVGPTGAGKSLLLALLAQRTPRGLTSKGEFLVLGQTTYATDLPIGPQGVSIRGSIHRALTLAPPHGGAGKRDPQQVERALKKAGIWDTFQARLSAPFQELPPDERLIILSTRALVHGLPFLLLDDPTQNLDPKGADQFRRIATNISKTIPVFWASRAYRRVAPTADRLIVLKDGRLLAEGDADDVSIAPPKESEKVLEDAVGSSADTGLEGLYRDLLALGSKGERAIHAAVQSLTAQNLPQARDVLGDEEPTIIKAEKIQSRALGLIARTAPIGQNLRTLYTIIEVARELKRIADHAVNIAEITLAIGEEPLIKPLIDIPRMAEKAQSMVRRSLDALVRRDVKLASQVNADDEHIDDLYRELFEELLGFVTDGGDSYRAGQALYLLFVARYLEKVADHAKGISNQVIFMVEGRRARPPEKGAGDYPQTFLPR